MAMRHSITLLAVPQDAENNWQFDIFAFADATPGHTLSLLGFHFYKTAGLIQHFQLDSDKLLNFMQKIESGYDMTNPYHNRSGPSAKFIMQPIV